MPNKKIPPKERDKYFVQVNYKIEEKTPESIQNNYLTQSIRKQLATCQVE